MPRMIPASAPPPKEFAFLDVAKYFGVSERRNRDLLARGELRGRREGRRQWVIDIDAVIEFAERAPHRKGRRLSIASPPGPPSSSLRRSPPAGRTVRAQWPAHYRAHYWREHGMPVGAAQDAPDIPRIRASVKRSAGLPLPPVELKDSIGRRPAMSMTAISAAEQAERERIIAAAIHSGEMEGLHVTEATKADTDKYIAGELDLDELAAKVRARYGIA